MADKFGLKIGVEGEKEFKSALADINRSFKVLGSEMKLVKSQFDSNDKSVEAITARNNVLNKQIDAQKEKIATLKAALDNAASSFGENDKRTQNWQVQLNNAEAALNDMEGELKENNKALETTEDNLEDTTKDADKFGDEVEDAGKQSDDAKGKFSKLGSTVKSVGKALTASIAAIGAAAVASGKKLWDMANQTAETGDKIDKNSQKIGISAESYQKWDYVFQRCGADVNNLQSGMKKLSGVITDAANGSDSAQAKLSAVGLSIEDLNGKSQDEQLSIVVSALQKMEAGAGRTAAANGLLGKSAVDMAAVLNMSAKETEALKKEAEDYGMVMSNDAVAASAAFEDSLTKMKGTISGLKNRMMGELLPGLTSITDGFSDLVAGNKEAGEEIKKGVSSVIESVSGMIPQAIELLNIIIQAVLENAPAIISALATGIIDALPTLVPVVGQVITQLVTTLLELLPQLVESGVQVIVSLAQGIGESLPTLIPKIVEVILKIVETIVSNIGSIVSAGVQIILGLVQGIISAIPVIVKQIPVILESIITALIEALPVLIDGVVQLINMLVEALPDIIAAIIEALPTILELIINAIVELLPVVIEGITSIITGIVNALPDLIVMIVEALPDLLDTIITALIELLPTLIQAILDCLPTLIEGLIELVLGIVKALPKIIKSLLKALPKMIKSIVTAIVECLPQLIQGAIDLIIGLVEHLPEIIIGLIEALPDIIEAVITGLIECLPQLIEGAIQLVIGLVKAIPKIIVGLIKAIPKIITSLVSAFGKGIKKFVEIGGNLIKGIWEGISNAAKWLWDQISGFFGGIVDGIKNFFGIHSPSALFRDQIGKNMALGIGEGFKDEMNAVADDMQDAIPTDFDTQVQTTVNTDTLSGTNALGRVINSFYNTFTFGEVHINSDFDIETVAHKVSDVIAADIMTKGGAYT